MIINIILIKYFLEFYLPLESLGLNNLLIAEFAGFDQNIAVEFRLHYKYYN